MNIDILIYFLILLLSNKKIRKLYRYLSYLQLKIKIIFFRKFF